MGRFRYGGPRAGLLVGSARRAAGWEVLVVLAAFPAIYIYSAVVTLVESVQNNGPSGSALPQVNQVWLADGLAITRSLVELGPVLLVFYLLWRSGEGPEAINLDRCRLKIDLALLLPVFILVQWIPQSLGAHIMTGFHLDGFPSPYSLDGISFGSLTIIQIAAGVSAGVLEEVVLLGYLVRRLEQRGHSLLTIVAINVALRAAYHLYYEWGAIPIVLWATATVLLYLRVRRLLPFILCHIAWDVAVPLRAFYHGTYTAFLISAVIITVIMTVAWRSWSPLLDSNPPTRSTWLLTRTSQP